MITERMKWLAGVNEAVTFRHGDKVEKLGQPFVVPTDWELYSSQPGAKAANRAFTNLAKKFVADINKIYASGNDANKLKTATIKYLKKAKELMIKYQDLGAYDSEPVHRVASFAIAAIADVNDLFDEDAADDLTYKLI